ncbi:dynein heavy chain and region D6 of dynein motor-domain-containing protein [Zopfochytrium polystomum]|nr:dynein heavy chain and region D6 of dynein motor-domain-containing protein [Zopfochytrium polystomum]
MASTASSGSSSTEWVARLASIHLLRNTLDANASQVATANFISDLSASSKFENFLKDSSDRSLSLFIALVKGTRLEVFSDHDVAQDDIIQPAIVLTKPKPGPVSDVYSLAVTKLAQSPESSLYQIVHGVFAPLAKNNRLSSSRKIQDLLADLDTSLASELVSGSSSVSSISEELSYWEKNAGFGTGKEKDRASLFIDIIKNISDEVKVLKSGVVVDVSEVAERIQDLLDDLWRQKQFKPYPQERMEDLLNHICSELVQNCKESLSSTYVMNDPFPEIKDRLRGISSTLGKVEDVIKSLTTKFWPNYGPHPWKSGAFNASTLRKFLNLVEEVLELRSRHEQLLHLLTQEEQNSTQLKTAYAQIASMRAFSVDPKVWKSALDKYNRLLAAVEELAAAKLSRRLGALHSQPHQMLQEFQRFALIVKRDAVFSRLATERQILLEQSFDSFKKTNIAIKDRVQLTKNEDRRSSKSCVSNIVWARQASAKIFDFSAIVEILDSKNTTFSTDAVATLSTLKRFEKSEFDAWVLCVQESLSDGTVRQRFQSGRLMELDRHGALVVNFEESYVAYIKECRQLLSLGFSVPNNVIEAMDSAKRFFRYGVVLKQVAHFYNTIHEQMLPCQHAMLLDHAKAFEHIVKEQLPTAQSRPTKQGPGGARISEIEDYIQRLQNCAGSLTAENRRLRKLHATICETVAALFSVDLVKPNTKGKWKDSLAVVRNYFSAALDSGGIKSDDTLIWRNHWDYQVYKVLEYQYQVSLESLTDFLPEIQVELVFQQSKLQFRPAFENIRANYYREMKTLINIPSAFKGFGDGHIFAHMVNRNANSLAIVYKKTETLFQNLHAVLDTFKDWVVLASIPIDDFIDEALVDVQDWEVNFRMLKAKGKEAEQLPSTIAVECIQISTAPVKATIDDVLQKLFDALVNSLRSAIQKSVTVIDDFVSKGMEVLANKPQSLEEIGDANARHEKLSEARDSVFGHFEAIEQKNRLLRSVAGGSVDISKSQTKWNKLEVLLESHELVIKEQVEALRAAIEGRKQALANQISKFRSRWAQLKPKVEDAHQPEFAAKAVASIAERRTEFEELVSTSSELEADCKHFNIEGPDVDGTKVLESELNEQEKMWQFYSDFEAEFTAMKKEDWLSIRYKVNAFEDSLMSWQEKLRSRPVDAVTVLIQDVIDQHHNIFPLFKFLRGDSWMSEHWGELFRIIEIPRGVALPDLTLGHILNAKDHVLAKLTEIKELNGRANAEVQIREALQELDMWGAGALFNLSEYVTAKGETVKIIKDWKDTITQVGDNQSLLQSLRDSPYYKHFTDKARIWEQRFVDLDEVLRNLSNIQRKWIYLEPIFNRGALPSEQSRFSRIDDDFCKICNFIAKDNRVITILNYQGIKETLNVLVDQLERCQKALNEYLEEKRSRFARFYFIGDEDLLEILGQAKNPAIIQNHLKKLFAGVHQVGFDESMTAIVSMISLEGEVVQLKTPVKISADIERWLVEFCSEMQETLRVLLNECLKKKDLSKYPCQILSLAEYIQFTQDCEAAIQGKKLPNLVKSLKSQLNSLTTFDTSVIEDMEERHVMEIKLKYLILDTIHFIDVAEDLHSNRVSSLDDWAWKRQVRFYMPQDFKDDLKIVMNTATFNYTFEYQGNPPKLVHTPLTDKCYLTLTQAMASGFGGNPFGPAGTGKTESVKALGVLFGRQVLVFNCDEGLDYKSMGRIFMGLVKCGAWGCFDEFNRLEEAVLSAVSEQIQVIQAALKSKQSKFTLLSNQVDLNPNSGIFVTLNPAGKGYGGRQRLPENLKQLFRAVAMTHPDNELISQVILFSEGFQLGKELGCKVVAVFSLCKQLLSPQQHYDWGLRPLKTVLSFAGRLLHAEKKSGPVSEKREMSIVVKALCVNTLSKLTFADSKRFNAIIADLFPKAEIENIKYDDLATAVVNAFAELNLEHNDTQQQKIFQLHEACHQRMGVVIVGPSGSGKSTLWHILERAWRKCGKKLKKYVMNPKAMDRHTLLGQMDMDTREWSDGILTYASRQAVKEPLDVHTWIICDGDIDPEWVESLNSVLDDNRLLTMPNGERIQFGPNINFIFETHNLKYASPATVSRMGMIYLSDEILHVKYLVKSWLRSVPDGLRTGVESWMSELFYRSLDWVLHNGQFAVETTRAGLIMNCFSHLAGCSTRLEFLFGLLRGLGSNLVVENRLVFAGELFSMANERLPDSKRILDYFVSDDRLHLYEVEVPEPSNDSALNEVESFPVVETCDVKRAMDTILPWLMSNTPFIVVGAEGAGKHTLLTHCFKKLRSATVSTIHCSSHTGSSHLLQRLSHLCIGANTNLGRILRPKDSERLILYLKDINLPAPDQYETVELIQFLQQLLSYKGFYDSNLEWIGIENIQIVASMTPETSMGRNKLSTRFTSIVRQCCISYPDREQLTSIYRILLSATLNQCADSHKTWTLPKNQQRLSATMLGVHEQVTQKFSADLYPHYIFTPRDLSRWVLGLRQYEISGDQETDLLDVFMNEGSRIYRDRLVTKEHVETFTTILRDVVQKEWNYAPRDEGAFIFSACASKGPRRTASLIKLGMDSYKEIVAKEIHTYERDNRDLNLCIFSEVLEGISKIERVLSQASGSLLMIGRPGVGRRSAVMIAAHMLKLQVFSPNISRSFGVKAFLAHIKEVLNATGVNNEGAVLLVEDHQLIEPIFLEYINSLLSGAEVPGLYSSEELDALLSSIKNDHSEEGFRGTLFEYFVQRVRRNLHTVLIMDSSSQQLHANCEANPALYTKCQIQWNEQWRADSCLFYCRKLFRENPSLHEIEDVERIIGSIMDIYCTQERRTPSHLVEYVKTYEFVYCKKLEQYQNKLKYLSGGLQKLNDASQFVDSLSAKARVQEVELAEKQKLADQALQQITESIARASDQKKEMETLSGQLKEEEEKMMERKVAIEGELSEVEPIVRRAKAAVGEIKNESLTEIRSLRSPPPAVRDVLEGVLRLMGILDMSWNSMKGFLGKRTIKDEIMNFDARNITPQVRESVLTLLKAKRESFDDATIKRVSVAAAPLAMWVKANIQYSAVLERIGPLEADLHRLKTNLEASQQRVLNLQQSLAVVDQNVAALREDFGAKTRDAEGLRANLEKASAVIQSSQGLLQKLSVEGKRWKKQQQTIFDSIKNLPQNSLLIAAFITFLSGSSEDVRTKHVDEWRKIVHLDQFDLAESMSTESEMLLWKSEGLPSDILSAQNAIAILNSVPTPLLIDPTSQAKQWLKSHLAAQKPEVVKQHDESFLRTVELALRFGKTLIIEDVAKIEAILYPVLRKDLIKQGPRYMVQLGDKTVDYNENFRLYLVTTNSSFSVPPDASALINEINFTITREGLSGQLLGITLKHEKPELEEEKIALLKNEDELKLQLAALEESLLRELASSDGNILENKSLIESLNETNSKSVSISKSLEESRRLQSALDDERQKFAPLARFGSRLFFVIEDLKKLNNMYMFSLPGFLRLFESALKFDGSASHDATDLRIKLLISALERITFKHVSRSLFKSDRQMFALHMIHQLHDGSIDPKEWCLFTGQLVLPDVDDEREITDSFSWIPAERRGPFKLVEKALPSLYHDLGLSDSEGWRNWMKSPNCEVEFPGAAAKKLSPFQRVIIVQALRPDRLLSAMNAFSCSMIGLQNLAPVALNMKKLYETETLPEEPILFITTPGADPSQELSDFAKQVVGPDNFRQISMGQGQGEIAIAELRRLAAAGGWLCLQNVHLVTSWLSELGKELQRLEAKSGFRLWMTSESHGRFPAELLKNSLKITVEAPPGIKKNLQRIYSSWHPDFVARGNLLRSQALFALAWFHAVIQERRNYIPQGWNKFYEFSAADLRSSAEVIGMMCGGANGGDSSTPQWPVLHGLLENAIYGARIDDSFDAMKLETYLALFFSDEIFGVNGKSPSRKLAKGINLPTLADHGAYISLINELPESETVTLFGLPANIDRGLQRNTSRNVLNQLKLMRSLDLQSERFDRERWSRELMPFLQLWKKLNTGNDLLQKKFPASDDTDPILSFLSLELTSSLHLLHKIHSDLSQLSKTLRNLHPLTATTQRTAASLLRREVPAEWAAAADPDGGSGGGGIGADPHGFLREAVGRAAAVDAWRARVGGGGGVGRKGAGGGDAPVSLRCLRSPGTFLDALRQETARAVSRPMDELTLTATWSTSSSSTSPGGLHVAVEGLLVQGCLFDGLRLSEVTQEDANLSSVPVVRVAWVPKDSSPNTQLRVPLYTTPSRERLVCSLPVPCPADDHSTWTLAGVAFFLHGI